MVFSYKFLGFENLLEIERTNLETNLTEEQVGPPHVGDTVFPLEHMTQSVCSTSVGFISQRFLVQHCHACSGPAFLVDYL